MAWAKLNKQKITVKTTYGKLFRRKYYSTSTNKAAIKSIQCALDTFFLLMDILQIDAHRSNNAKRKMIIKRNRYKCS